MRREAGNLRLATFREHFRITRVVAVDDCELVSKPGNERTFLYSYLRLGARKIQRRRTICCPVWVHGL